MWNHNDTQKHSSFEIGLAEGSAVFVDVRATDMEIIAIHQQFRYKK